MRPPDWDQATLARACRESWILVAPGDRAFARSAIERGGAVIGTAPPPGAGALLAAPPWPGWWCEIWCCYGPDGGPWAPEPARLVAGATPSEMGAVAAALGQEHILLDAGDGWRCWQAIRGAGGAVTGYRPLAPAAPLPVDEDGNPLDGSP